MIMKNFRLLLQQIKKTLIACRISLRGVSSRGEFDYIINSFDRLRIQEGPFKGMRYINSSYGSIWHPKILGTYEKEIIPLITGLDYKKYNNIIDIGCAEGYYLAGLAMLASKGDASPGIVGYDLSEGALAMARNLLAINHIPGRLLNQRFDFNRQTEEANLYLVDIEGAEKELFQGVDMKRFRTSEFIVEVHDPKGRDDMLEFLKNTFAPTHEVSVVFRQDRRPADFPDVLGIRVRDGLKMELMDEQRCYGNAWLFASCRK